MKNILKDDLSEPLFLYPSRKIWIFVGLIFGFMSIFMLLVFFLGGIQSQDRIGALLGFILVTSLTVFSFLNLSKKVTYFKLTKNGFEQSFCSIKKSFLWKDISGFGIHIILNGKPIIGFNVREGFQDKTMFMKTTNGKIFDKMFDYKYQISDNYGNDSYVFLDYLNEMLLKYKE